LYEYALLYGNTIVYAHTVVHAHVYPDRVTDADGYTDHHAQQFGHAHPDHHPDGHTQQLGHDHTDFDTHAHDNANSDDYPHLDHAHDPHGDDLSTISPTITLTATPLSSITVTVTVTITPVLVKPGAIFSYPAPARGAEVWFYFNAPKPGRVEIELYNVAGEKITNLGEDLAQSGNGRLRWTLGSVAPGVYLYRVRFLDHGGQGDWSGIQKMAVVKNAGVH